MYGMTVTPILHHIKLYTPGNRYRLLVAMLLVGCATTTSYVMSDRYSIESPIPFEPPTLYETVYDNILECVGGEPVVEFEGIRFFKASWLYDTEGNRYPAAISVPRINRIYITADRLEEEGVVGHEILHLLLPTYTHWHPKFDACDPILSWRL